MASAATVGAGLTLRPDSILANSGISTDNDKPAILGGAKAIPDRFPKWPIYDNVESKGLLDVLYSDKWGRLDGKTTTRFEEEYAKISGAQHCLATTSGTSALLTMLGALGVGPGDEVIIPVYTFIATYNVVVLNYALPVIVDMDPDSFQIDPKKIEAAITKNTKAIMPVHMGGSPADMDAILDIGKKNNIPVLEDACQAPLAEWRGKKVGTLGLAGGLSFQSSKNLCCGEGGAVISNDKKFIDDCYKFHNQGWWSGSDQDNNAFDIKTRGSNLRITEFQSGILLSQMTRLIEQSKIRYENALYLNSLFNEIPGLVPAKLYEGVTNSTYHFYMFRYEKEGFAGMSREQFMRAMSQEGVNLSSGYGRIYPYITNLAKSKYYLKIYGEKEMKRWLERIECPVNEKIANEHAVWLSQPNLLGSRKQIEQIAVAARKIQKYAKEIINSQ